MPAPLTVSMDLMRWATFAGFAVASAVLTPRELSASCDPERIRGEMQAFRRQHSKPPPFVTEAWTEYNRALFSASGPWVASCPEDLAAWSARFLTLAFVDGVPADEITRTVHTTILLWERTAPEQRGEAPYFRAARIYVTHGIASVGVEDWIVRGEAAAASPGAEWEAWMLRAESRLVQGAVEPAEGALSKLGSLLAAADPGPGADPLRLRAHRARAAGFWRVRALLAERSGQRADAAVFYRRALEFSPDDPKLLARADAAWKALGGTGEGLAALREMGAEASRDHSSPWEPREHPLQPFDVLDTAGKRWTLDTLRGKVVLINMWATWCAPCKVELPHVQAVADRLRPRGDIVVLTLNADAQPAAAAAFAAEQRLGIPVLLAMDYVQEILGGGILIPQSWIVDKTGTVRLALSGFNPGRADAWVSETVSILESLAR